MSFHELELDIHSPPEGVRIDNSFINELPVETFNADNQYKPHDVQSVCSSRVSPTKGGDPRCIAFNTDLASFLSLPKVDISGVQISGQGDSENNTEDFILTQVLSGNALYDGMKPYAMCYGGHQFGNWAGQLGDGRAIALGEVLVSESAVDLAKSYTGTRFTLQLKGVGPTPYSRHADGYAVLRSSIREYLCSEAMYHLGVPTTRALSLSLRGESVERDMFYDGNAQMEPAATVCRVSESFIRFGNFEILASRGDYKNLEKLAEYTIKHHFSDLYELFKKDSAQAVLKMFSRIASSTKTMVLHWDRVGFVHGVMNTDNMSILGQTIDYGPYGWLDNFDPNWTPNTTDSQHRRYRYGNQAAVAQWNLLQLANALYPLVKESSGLESVLTRFAKEYECDYVIMRAQKLGIGDTEDIEPKLEKLINDLDTFLVGDLWDWTLFHRCLSSFLKVYETSQFVLPIDGVNDLEPITSSENLVSKQSVVEQWEILSSSFLNDHFILAFYGDEINGSYFKTLRDWLVSYLFIAEGYRNMKNLSIEDIVNRMDGYNPFIVLRNYITQQAIEAGQADDFSILLDIEKAFKTPYTENDFTQKFSAKRPTWALHKPGCSMLSCSS